MFLASLQAVLDDDGFKFPSPPAAEAQNVAERLLTWCSNSTNVNALTVFLAKIFEQFDCCISCSTRKTSHKKKMERIWEAFHKTRCSPEYKQLWSAFLKASVDHSSESPIFYQFITDYMFKLELKKNFEVRQEAQYQPQCALTFEEKNCIRYIAGSMYRAIHKKIKKIYIAKEGGIVALPD